MDYVIFDLEWNRDTKNVRSKCPDEIIQIGAVKYDSKLNYAGSYSALIKPAIYGRLDQTVKNITGISMEKLMEEGVPYPKAFKRFREFMGRDFVLMSWGCQDITILHENCVYYNRNMNLSCFSQFADLQYYISKDKRIKTENSQIGLKTAAEKLDIRFDEGSLHDALADAALSGEVFVKAFDSDSLAKQITDGRNINTHVKGVHITDVNNKAVNKKEFHICCPQCGKFAKKTFGWYRRDKSFFAVHRCKNCNIEMISNLDIVIMYDQLIKYKKKTIPIEKVDI